MSVGLLHIHFRFGHRSAIGSNVVVVIAVRNQTSVLAQLALNVVVILTVVFLRDLGRLVHLAGLIEPVDARRFPVIVLDHFILAVHNCITRLVDVVVGVVQFDQAGILTPDTILIVGQLAILIHQCSGPDNHAVLTHAIGTFRKQLVSTDIDLRVSERAAIVLDPVEVAFILNQVSLVVQSTVDVVVQLAVILLDQFSGQDHLAVLIETVDAAGLFVVMLDNVVLAVRNCITRIVNVVVGVIQRDQACIPGQDTVLVVGQVAAFVNQLGGQEDLAVRACTVDTALKRQARTKADLRVGEHEAVDLDPVVVALILNQSRSVSHSAIDVVVPLAIRLINQFSGQDRLAIIAEAIGAKLQREAIVVGDLLLDALQRNAAFTNVVVILVDQD